MDDDEGDRSRIEKAIEAVKDMASSTTYAANSAATPSEEEKMTVMDVPLVADAAAMPMPLVAPKKGKARAKRAPKTPPKKAAAAKAAKKTAKKSATAAKNSKRAAKHSPAAAGRKVVGKKKVAKKKKAKTSRR
jgi:hypothetical protein